jgi:hypothetical protein
MDDDDLITHLAVRNFDPPTETPRQPEGWRGWIVAVVLLLAGVLLYVLI